MIVPDINLLVYVYNVDAPHHAPARRWWEQVLSARTPVGMPVGDGAGFRTADDPQGGSRHPLQPEHALGHVRSWLTLPGVEMLDPGPRRLEILEQLFAALGTAGRLTTDAHLAALAIEYQLSSAPMTRTSRAFPGCAGAIR